MGIQRHAGQASGQRAFCGLDWIGLFPLFWFLLTMTKRKTIDAESGGGGGQWWRRHSMAVRLSSSSGSVFYVINNRDDNSMIGRTVHRHTSSAATHQNTLVAEAVRLLGPPARFDASKLKVDFKEKEITPCSGIIPRTYILSHCDITANLTLTISNVISLHQLRGWYCKDDVVGEWKVVNNDMRLHIHCFVSGPNSLIDLAAEFRYQIFSKEMPLVLKAMLHGDASLFRDHPELMDSVVWVYFHSSLQKYNRMECWGPLKDAGQGKQRDQLQGGHHHLTGREEGYSASDKWRGPKSIFQALFAFLL